MAATKKAAAAKAAKTTVPVEVDVVALSAQVKDQGEGINAILALLEEQKAARNAPAAAVVETPDVASVSQVESTKAKANNVSTNPEWEEAAREILGAALDHTEVEHKKSGGIEFTVVIKKSHSNAPEDYWKLVGSDRRTKEVSQDGIGGVELWCKQIKANLARTPRTLAN